MLAHRDPNNAETRENTGSANETFTILCFNRMDL
jgi:hypothetical protein